MPHNPPTDEAGDDDARVVVHYTPIANPDVETIGEFSGLLPKIGLIAEVVTTGIQMSIVRAFDRGRVWHYVDIETESVEAVDDPRVLDDIAAAATKAAQILRAYQVGDDS